MEDILDVLLDENNKEPILLGDENGNKILFEQIAIIPHNGKLYCILKPITHVNGISENEAVVFYVEADNDPPFLKVEEDELTAIDIFEEYYNLLEKHRKAG